MKFEFEKEDFWSLDITLSKVIVAALKEFKEKNGGWPAYLKNQEEWEGLIQEMIDGFQLVADEKYCPPLNDDVTETVERALSLFKEHFNNLWY